jgi:UDP-N-acetylglucosamine 1-carboxyvinyltransferase
MDKIEIQGGVRLSGEVTVGGAKNAALPIMAAALLAPGRSLIHNVPRLQDVSTMLKILSALGARCEFIGPSTLAIDASVLSSQAAPYELVRRMRASVLVLGALLARSGRAVVSLPGGCVIGPRPVDLHLKGLKALNARISLEHGYIEAEGGDLRGAEVDLRGSFGSSVGATINVLLAAVRSRGRTIIANAAREPEVADTAGFLAAMGASVSGAGTSRLVVDGVDRLRPAEYSIIPDRIEAGTYLVAGALAGDEIAVVNARPEHLEAVIETLRVSGVGIEIASGRMTVRGGGVRQAHAVTTAPYPAFPTDMAAQMLAFFAVVPGLSRVTETVYPDRFMHVPELNRLGARIVREGQSAVVRGVAALSGAQVMASDLRASAALVMAGLIAGGTTLIDRVYHLDRGYERMEEKLRALGARIKRIK